MLEKDYQLSAYKKLAAAGGMKTPGAITSARNSANTAKLLAEELTGLILDTIVGTVAKLAMRQPFVLFKGLTFQKLC
ncbi:hypothetical protein AB7Y05_26985, partial [Escherichia coli]